MASPSIHPRQLSQAVRELRDGAEVAVTPGVELPSQTLAPEAPLAPVEDHEVATHLMLGPGNKVLDLSRRRVRTAEVEEDDDEQEDFTPPPPARRRASLPAAPEPIGDFLDMESGMAEFMGRNVELKPVELQSVRKIVSLAVKRSMMEEMKELQRAMQRSSRGLAVQRGGRRRRKAVRKASTTGPTSES